MDPNICSVCHQPIIPEYYFCPNCGAKLHEPPLSTTPSTQAEIYAFSIVLPMICFLFITRWPGPKYFKSEDPKAKQIGQIAWVLLILSTIIVIWLAYTGTQRAIDRALDSVNTEFGF